MYYHIEKRNNNNEEINFNKKASRIENIPIFAVENQNKTKIWHKEK